MKEPNKEVLTNWLDGKLEGEELNQVEAWAADNAGNLDHEFKCKIGWGALNDDYLVSVPKSEEPPYPEFFNSKLEQAIMAEEKVTEPVLVPVTGNLWQKLRLMVMPAAVAAAVAFYAGMQMKGDDGNTSVSARELMVEVIYVPDENVQAEVSDTVDATEIVLDGLSPISDDFDMNVSSVPTKQKAGESTMIMSQAEGKVFY